MPLPAISLAVVGADFPNKRGPTRRFEIAICKPGEPVELRLEPRNPADDQAVAVFSGRDVQLGYITAQRAGRITTIIKRGHEVRAIFDRPMASGAWIRVAFDGELPTLREPRDEMGGPEVSDTTFWPDDIPPND